MRCVCSTDAIVYYVIHSKPSAKSRGVEILVRLLLEIQLLDAKPQPKAGEAAVAADSKQSSDNALVVSEAESSLWSINFDKLAPLSAQMDSVLDRMSTELDAGSGGLQSPNLQAILELLSTADLVQTELKLKAAKNGNASSKDSKKSTQKESEHAAVVVASGADSKKLIDVGTIGVYRLRIDKAVWGPTNSVTAAVSGASVTDITSELQEYVRTWCGDTQLVLPLCSPQLMQMIPGFESVYDDMPGGKNKSKKGKKPSGGGGGNKSLRVQYRIVCTEYNVAREQLEERTVKSIDKTWGLTGGVSRPLAVLAPVRSWLDRMKEVSRLTLDMQYARSALPTDFLIGAYRLAALSASYYSLVPFNGVELVPPTLAKPKGDESDSEADGGSGQNAKGRARPRMARRTSSGAGGSGDAAASDGFGLAVPDSGYRGANWSLMFWLYLTEFAPSKPAPLPSSASAKEKADHAAATSALAPRSLLQKGTARYASNAFEYGGQNVPQLLPRAGFSLTLGATDNTMTLALYSPSSRDDPNNDANSNTLLCTTKTDLRVNAWYHVCINFEAQSGAQVLLNGQTDAQVQFGSRSQAPPHTPDPYYIGRLPPGVGPLRPGLQSGNQLGSNVSPIIPSVAALVADMRLYTSALSAKTLASYIKAVGATASPHDRHQFHTLTPPSAADISSAPLVSMAQLHAAARGSSSVSLPGRSDQKSDSKEHKQQSKTSGSTATAADSVIDWTSDMDSQVIALFDSYAKEEEKKRLIESNARNGGQPQPSYGNQNSAGVREISLLDLAPASVDLTARSDKPSSSGDGSSGGGGVALASFGRLSNVPVAAIQCRFALIQLLNERVERVIPLVDFSQAGARWSLAHRLSSLSSLILMAVKQRSLNYLLQLTNSGGGNNVTIDQGKAAKAREKSDDADGRRSVFGQMFQELHFLRPSQLRCTGAAWHVTYVTDGVQMEGIDAGGTVTSTPVSEDPYHRIVSSLMCFCLLCSLSGLFRDSITAMCTDLQSKAVPLFIPCPNARHDLGENKEKWIPNPACTSSIHLSMYAFVGTWRVLLLVLSAAGVPPSHLSFFFFALVSLCTVQVS